MIFIILVEPLYGGNVGLVARAMANFNVKELRIVKGRETGEEAKRRAKHGLAILEEAKRFEDLPAAIEDLDIIIATTGVLAKKEKDWVRKALGPEQVREKIEKYDGRVGILFGRENYGLYNEELGLADMVMHIPTSEEYPVLNLSHAVAITLYSLIVGSKAKKETPASRRERELLRKEIKRALSDIEYPAHRRRKTYQMIDRILGRAGISDEEFRVLMGVLKRTR